jgi:hypothetical protein
VTCPVPCVALQQHPLCMLFDWLYNLLNDTCLKQWRVKMAGSFL